jgi:hypothetical protein
MKKLITAIAVIVVALMVVPPAIYASEYYVIRDKAGHTAVTNGLPGYGWILQSGPYATVDSAQRATGTGVGTSWSDTRLRAFNFPQVVPRSPGQSIFAELTP